MTLVSSAEAVSKFDKILAQVSLGQEIVIIGPNGSEFKLVAMPAKKQYPSEEPSTQVEAWMHSSQLKSQQAVPATAKPVFGSARGLINIGPNFDDPIDGFEEYMP